MTITQFDKMIEKITDVSSLVQGIPLSTFEELLKDLDEKELYPLFTKLSQEKKVDTEYIDLLASIIEEKIELWGMVNEVFNAKK